MFGFNGILVAFRVFLCESNDNSSTLSLSPSLFLSYCWWDLVLNSEALSVSLLSANVIYYNCDACMMQQSILLVPLSHGINLCNGL